MTKGRLYLLLSAVLYGIVPTLSAMAYRGGINGITLTFLRGFLSLPVLLAMIIADKRRLRQSSRKMKQIVILALVGQALPILLLFISYYYIATGIATTLHFIYPLVIVISSALIYRQRLPRVTLSAVMLVTVGIFMFSDIGAASNRLGVLLALLSGIFYSFYVIYLKHSGLESMDYVVLTFYVMLIMSAAVLIFGLLSGNFRISATPLSWSLCVMIALMVSLGAMPLFQTGLRREGEAEAGIFSTMEPVTSMILGSMILGEEIGASRLMGVAVILFGIILMQKRTIPQEELRQ